jgi:hypothetical protein
LIISPINKLKKESVVLMGNTLQLKKSDYSIFFSINFFKYDFNHVLCFICYIILQQDFK